MTAGPTIRRRVEQDAVPWGETPLTEVEALATAYAAAAGRSGYSSEDVTDSVHTILDLLDAGIVLGKELSAGPQSIAMKVLASSVARARMKMPLHKPERPEPLPKDVSQAEWIRAELRQVGFDVRSR